MKVEIYDPAMCCLTAGKKEFTLFTAKKGLDKSAAVFLASASEKGRSTLRLGDNMWLYILKGGKKVTSAPLKIRLYALTNFTLVS